MYVRATISNEQTTLVPVSAEAFPLLSETFHYSNTQLSYIGAFSEAAYALGKFINGPFTDKVGGQHCGSGKAQRQAPGLTRFSF